jgi:hypothetical protein
MKNGLNVALGGEDGIRDLVFDNSGNTIEHTLLLPTVPAADIHLDCKGRIVFTNRRKARIFLLKGERDVQKVARFIPSKP